MKLLRATSWFLALLVAVVLVQPTAAERSLRYNRDIRPILFDKCIACHGPDSAARQSELRLDQRESALELGAIVPGEPDSSELVRRICSTDEFEQMPPPEIQKPLRAEEIETLTKWIREGAKYEPHWSLIPPRRPALPEVKNSEWVRNPIDHFVAARLEEAALEPASEADRRTLARRVSLDLTGLPPSVEIVEAYLNDDSPDAYENLVDRLLQSPRWGEHRARYWLDVARYADTHGIHFDNYREMWSYRDWVIRAFNENMPFDQFTIENLAGDLLPDATLSQKIGSGFNRCNITTNEGGALDEEYEVLYTRDRTETTAQAFMGLTAGCAVCHDHKFDPLPQREFYELAAFFNNTTQRAMDGNIKDTPPVVVVPTRKDLPRWKELKTALAMAQQQLDQRRSKAREEFHTWIEDGPEDLDQAISDDQLHLAAPLNDGGKHVHYSFKGEERIFQLPAEIEWQTGPDQQPAAYVDQKEVLAVEDAGNFDTLESFSVAVWLKLPANDTAASVVAHLNEAHKHQGWDMWIEGRRVGSHLIHAWPQNAIKVVAEEQLPANVWNHVALVYDGSGKAAGLEIYVNGIPQKVNIASDTLPKEKTIRTNVPLVIGRRYQGTPLSGATLSDVRIYERELQSKEISALAGRKVLAVLEKPAAERTAEELDALYDWWLTNQDDAFQEMLARRETIERETRQIAERGTRAHVMEERDQAAIAYVLNRGEYDQPQEKVTPDTPSMLPPFPEEFPRNRLGLANWLLLEEHPLTARVAVNRFWQELFGRGLVETAGDFGMTGQVPSHPKLLDWLAVEFRQSGWDVKHMYKLLVTSATYRQSAAVTPEKFALDPENHLLALGPRFRMDAEMVRDYALSVSGLLVDKIGGPSVKPYQPPGVWEAVAMIGSNTRDYRRDDGDALYRRSLYTFWKRSAPPASLDIFNAPNREHCVMVRERTNTPLQALVTLNDTQFVEAARHLATATLHEADESFEQRVQFLGNRLLMRPFREAEIAVIRATYDKLAKYYEDSPDQAQQLLEVGESEADESLPAEQLAAWTMTVNQLMNLDEVLNK